MTGLQVFAMAGVACFAVALGLWALVRGGALRGEAEAEAVTAKHEAVRTAEVLQDVVKGQTAAAEVRKRKTTDKTPDQIVRANDGRWP